MSLVIRAVIWVTLITSILLIFLPMRVLAWTGLQRPERLGAIEAIGIAMVVAGAALALWCIVVFVVIGRGTPAPYDPPRKLVVRGPYKFVRNPMYVGVGIALAGAALVYRSIGLLGYMLLLFVIVHLLIVFYEEPTLRRTFGADYDQYVTRVSRWWPSLPTREHE